MANPTFPELARVFHRIGWLSFGGPAAQIALMHRECVEEHPWLTERQFLNALSFCMLLPGPEAMQLATYTGWRLKGIPGGLIAGGLFVLPGAFVIAALAMAYVTVGATPGVDAVLLGVKATVIVIVVQALVRLTRKGLTGGAMVALAGLAFVGIYVFSIPFPVIVAAAALFGYLTRRGETELPREEAASALPWHTIALWTTLWLLPLPLLWLSGATLFLDLAAFFAKLAIVTFGGAYAVLAYMSDVVVETNGWLTAGQMIDALGLAETTPGPLILVTQFVGMLTGYAAHGPVAAIAAGVLTLWMTFVPCFLWIFAFAGHVESLLARSRLQGALSAVTAAVVGVILNLSIWFAIHVLFTEVREAGALSVSVPVPATLDPHALLLVALAAVLMLVLKRGPVVTLAATGLAGGILGAM
ncbi:chromate transporter [Roseivivax halodurans JCM 10272]|uniref:Chromate transporter n=1 Tax=Roseivivax halodurans JCM 10272 TaxID=1449350 RepID=X7EKG1_9RHOB|nr:chromate efflux transporter [Roseivivax halodurans]ETX15671.1 chromate transporter [Roseivivax halodurans JCM 10272]